MKLPTTKEQKEQAERESLRTTFQERTYNKRMPWAEASRGCDPAFAKLVHDWGMEMQRCMARGASFDGIVEPAMAKAGIDKLSEREQHRAFLVLERGWKFHEELVAWRMARAEKPKTRVRKSKAPGK